ncbi:MAG: alpha/beta hydrolase [Acidimicrobiia bacterium]
MTTATVVLVHGAWHGAWCWEPVVAGLVALDVPAVAVDLPGHGVDRAPVTDLHGHGDAVRAALGTVDGPVVLVGHSYGGAAITDAGTHPNVRRLVYVSAFCLDAHETVMTNDLAGGAGSDLEQAIVVHDDGTATIDPERARVPFYDDCDPTAAAAAVAQLSPELLTGFGQQPRAVAWRERPSTFALCSADRAVTPELQRNLAARCDDVVTWPTSHSPFLSRPDLVVDLLAGLARADTP